MATKAKPKKKAPAKKKAVPKKATKMARGLKAIVTPLEGDVKVVDNQVVVKKGPAKFRMDVVPDLTPAERPANYQRVHMPAGKSPVPFKGDPKNTFEVLHWAEAVRDEFEKNRTVPSQSGLMMLARSAQGQALADTVRDLYANEPSPARPRTVLLECLRPLDRFHDGVHNCELVSLESEGDAKVRVLTGPGAGLTVNWSRRSEVYPSQMPHVPAQAVRRGKDRSGATSPDTGPRERRTRQSKPDRIGEPPAKLDNQTDIPVEWTGSGGRFKCTILGHPMRGVCRWLGWKGFDADQAMALMKKLGVEAYPDLKSIVSQHVKSGQAGDKGCHGAPAALTEDEAKKLKKHLK